MASIEIGKQKIRFAWLKLDQELSAKKAPLPCLAAVAVKPVMANCGFIGYGKLQQKIIISLYKKEVRRQPLCQAIASLWASPDATHNHHSQPHTNSC